MGLLTIICPCYNQANFIRAALDGFVRQKTSFDFIVLVGDDASTDGTPAVVQEYAAIYPNIIKPVLREKNLGPSANARDLYTRVTSKYVAICEGDDYWTDEFKLQKQVDFLESHPDCAICFHPVSIWNEQLKRSEGLFPDRATRFDKFFLNLEDLVKRNFIQTNSVVYRWRFKENDPELADFINSDMQPGDHIMHLVHAETGAIGYIDEVMAVYRRHPGGIWTGAGISDQWFLKYGLPSLNFYVFKEKRFRHSQPETVKRLALGLLAATVTSRKFKPLEQLAVDQPAIYAKAAASLKSYSIMEGKNTMWRVGLHFIWWRYHLMVRITRGRRRECYQRKISELESLLAAYRL